MARERALVGKNHPNLVPILDAGEDSGFFDVAMARVPGKPLSKCLSPDPAQSNLGTNRASRLRCRVSRISGFCPPGHKAR